MPGTPPTRSPVGEGFEQNGNIDRPPRRPRSVCDSPPIACPTQVAALGLPTHPHRRTRRRPPTPAGRHTHEVHPVTFRGAGGGWWRLWRIGQPSSKPPAGWMAADVANGTQNSPAEYRDWE